MAESLSGILEGSGDFSFLHFRLAFIGRGCTRFPIVPYRQNRSRYSLKARGRLKILWFCIGAGACLLFRVSSLERFTFQTGDSLKISGRRIRLWGIDAPELGQRCEWRDRAISKDVVRQELQRDPRIVLDTATQGLPRRSFTNRVFIQTDQVHCCTGCVCPSSGQRRAFCCSSPLLGIARSTPPAASPSAAAPPNCLLNFRRQQRQPKQPVDEATGTLSASASSAGRRYLPSSSNRFHRCARASARISVSSGRGFAGAHASPPSGAMMTLRPPRRFQMLWGERRGWQVGALCYLRRSPPCCTMLPLVDRRPNGMRMRR